MHVFTREGWGGGGMGWGKGGKGATPPHFTRHASHSTQYVKIFYTSRLTPPPPSFLPLPLPPSFTSSSTEIIECPSTANCKGGTIEPNSTIDSSLCVKGAGGPLCQLCDAEYFLSEEYGCVECKVSGWGVYCCDFRRLPITSCCS